MRGPNGELPADFFGPGGPPAWLGGLRGGGHLFVKGLNGQTMVIDDVQPWTTILDVKMLILHKLGYIFTQPPDIRLIFGGRSLSDTMCPGDYNIASGNTLFLLFRLRGGMDAGAFTLATNKYVSSGNCNYLKESKTNINACYLLFLSSTR